jgi:hypothetical protein
MAKYEEIYDMSNDSLLDDQLALELIQHWVDVLSSEMWVNYQTRAYGVFAETLPDSFVLVEEKLNALFETHSHVIPERRLNKIKDSIITYRLFRTGGSSRPKGSLAAFKL